MDNQHRKIKGYTELSQEQIDLMNLIKTKAAEVGELVSLVIRTPDFDPRWAAIGKTDLQTGFMALTRSVANPDFF